MPSFILSRRFLTAGALLSAIVSLAAGFTPQGAALGTQKPDGAAGAEGRTVSYLREVRPILTQHCFQCHGPDEAARKGKLRLDLQDHAYAERDGLHVIAPGNPDGSLAWQRITSDETRQRMPPEGKAEPLSTKQIATLKAWIE